MLTATDGRYYSRPNNTMQRIKHRTIQPSIQTTTCYTATKTHRHTCTQLKHFQRWLTFRRRFKTLLTISIVASHRDELALRDSWFIYMYIYIYYTMV